MPYRYFLLPLVVLVLVYLFYTYKIDDEPSVYIILPAIILIVLIWILKHPINEWWWQKYSLDLSVAEKHWLNENFVFLKYLNEEKKQQFFKELAVFSEMQEYIPMGEIKVVEELKWMSIAPAILLQLYKKPELRKHYIRTVFYKHPFITPDHDYIHVSETHHEDGTLIFSIEQLVNSYLKPNQFFNPAVYEWSIVANQFYKLNFSATSDSIMKLISEKLNSSFDNIFHWTGLKQINENALFYYCFVLYNLEMKKLCPEDFSLITSRMNAQLIDLK